MYVTACLAGQDVDVEVGEECRSLQALKEAIVKELPQLCVDGFDVSVGGCALDDTGAVSLEASVRLDVVPNTRGLSALALREAGREVSEAGLCRATRAGDVALVTLYLDAGVPTMNRGGRACITLLHHAAWRGHLKVAALLLDRSITDIDAKDGNGHTPLHLTSTRGHLALAAFLLDRGCSVEGEDYSPEVLQLISEREASVVRNA